MSATVLPSFLSAQKVCKLFLAFFLLGGLSAASAQSATPDRRVSNAYGKLPMQFERNDGQADGAVKFVARGIGYNILLRPDAATFSLYGPDAKAIPGKAAARKPAAEQTVEMELLGIQKNAAMTAEKPLGGYVNYITGGDPKKWLTGVPTAAQTRVAGVYPGVDLVYYGTQRQLEYDFVVTPGARAESIRFALRGAKAVLAADGDLILQRGTTARSEDMRFLRPVLYQNVHGERKSVEGAFVVAKDEVHFQVGAYDHMRDLIIDPIISYASYFGGSQEDEINGSALNAAGQLYAVGQTYSSNLPGTAGEFQAVNIPIVDNINLPGSTVGGNGQDGFVTKFSADGSSVLWTTYLGGSLYTFITAVAVSAADQAYVTGVTSSSGSTYFQSGATYNIIDFPVTADAVQPLGCPTGGSAPGTSGLNEEVTGGCGGEVFVSRLSADGKSLLYSTFLGGQSNYADVGTAIALDAANNIYVAGYTNSTGYEYAVSKNLSDVPSYPVNQHGVAAFGASAYPTTANAYQTAFAVAKAQALGAGPDGSGNLGALGQQQAFVTEISADGSKLIYSSAIGGGSTGYCYGCSQSATTVTPGPNGLIYVGGVTNAPTFPVTTGAFLPACTTPGGNSLCATTGWLTAFDTTKSGAASLAFSTYITGTVDGTNSNGTPIIPSSRVSAATTDSAGNVVITGQTNACNYPTTPGTIGAVSKPHGDGNGDSNVCATQGFITKLTPAGATVWSTYLEGTGNGTGNGTLTNGVALDAAGDVYVLATADDSTLPLKNSVYAPNGGQDAYLIEVSPDAKQTLMATFLGSGGGLGIDNNSLHLDSNLNAYFSGWQCYNTYGGTSFPTTAGAFIKTIGGNCDGYVVKMITQQQPSATALTVSPTGNAAPTQTVTLTAKVTTSSTLTGSILPTGTITFMNGSAMIGTGTLNASGVATYSGTLAGGSYSITAVYAGNAGFNGSTSTAAALTVSSAVTTATALTVSAATIAYGAAATLTATVTAGTAAATSGTVSFAAGTVSFGNATVNAQGVATLSVKPGVGGYSVVASYAGTYDATSNPTGYAASVSAGIPLTVTKAASTTALASSAASVGTGASVTLTATVTTGATGMVTFYSGGTTSLGTATVGTGGVATLVTSFSAANTYSLTATYAGDGNFAGSGSTAVSEVVVVPSFSVTASPSSLTISRGSTGMTTLTFTPVGGYSGAITLACGSLPAKATCTFNPATVTLAGAVVTDTLTIGAGTVTTSKLSTPQGDGRSGIYSATMLWLPASMLGLLGLAWRRKLRGNLQRLTLLAGLFLLSLGAITGCSGGTTTNYANATPVGSYTVPVTVTGTTGGAQSVSLTVVVQ